jgi:hypothetical protein
VVRGLELFRTYFAPYLAQYSLIGGTACTLLFEAVGLDFRSTRDLDIVLHLENLNEDFVQVLWAFITEGGYQNRQKSDGRSIFYRFQIPADERYPTMLELFSRLPDNVKLHGDDAHLTPIPMDGEITSLSAILLDDAYYRLILAGKIETAGLSVVSASHLIPLKAKAWLDLSERRATREKVDQNSVRKHRNDVFKLFQILDPTMILDLPDPVRADMRQFLTEMAVEPGLDLGRLGLHHMGKQEVLHSMRTIYGIGG